MNKDFEILNGTLKKYHGNDKVVTVPKGVTAIGDRAFHMCNNINEVILPKGLKSIGNYAFNVCYKMERINIPETVTLIGHCAFENCNSLKQIIIPDSVTFIGAGCFYFCLKLSNITLSNNITSINDETFTWCKNLKKIVLPNGITSIGHDAFKLCKNLQELVIPNSVTSIGSYAFLNCDNLKKIIIPNSVISMGKCVFNDNCNVIFKIDNNVEVSLKWKNNPYYEEDIFKEFICTKTRTKRKKIFLTIKDTNYKYPLAIAMAITNDNYFKSYIRKNIFQILKYIIYNHEVENLNKILNLDIINDKQLDKIFDYANNNNKTEEKLIILNYKNSHFGFNSIPDFTL